MTELIFRLLDVHRGMHGQVSLVWTSGQENCHSILITNSTNPIPGSYGAPEGCNAWGGGGVITICLGVGQVLFFSQISITS